MKKLIITLAAIALSLPSFSWGRLGHATIAQIAQDHLTPTTQKAVKEYLNGEVFAGLASIPDDYRKDLDKMGLKAAHTYSVDENRESYRVKKLNGKKITNNLLDIDKYAKDLYHNAKDQNDTIRACEIIILVHIVGDMHCPGHVRYAPELDHAYYNVMFRGEPMRFHTILDQHIVSVPTEWSYGDLARICDIASEKEIRDIVKGDQYDWGTEHANACLEMRSVKPDEEITRRWLMDHTYFTRECLRKGGYRLAHVLNTIFDPSYAKRYGRDLIENWK